MMTTAIWGYRAIEKLSVIAVPLLVVLIFTALYLAFSKHSFHSVLTGSGSGNYSFGMAVSLVIGIFIVGTVISPDVARWARTRKDAVLASTTGFFIGNSFMLIVAIILSKVMSSSNLTAIFISLGLGIPAIFVLTLAQWTTNTNNLYSSALGFSVVFRNVSKPVITLFAGLFATLLAFLGIFDYFVTFLSIITTLVTPIGGIYIAEYFFVGAKNLSFGNNRRVSKTILRSLAAWLFASLFAFLTTPAPNGFGLFQFTTIPALDGIILGAALQTLFGKVLVSRKQVMESEVKEAE
jgi:cytosine permease